MLPAALAALAPAFAQDAPARPRAAEIGREGATRGGQPIDGRVDGQARGDRAPADAERNVVPRSDPWSREVAVADRGPEQRREALALAMRAVLLANSGDKTLLNRDDVRAGLRDAERFVERFDYRIPPPGTLIPADTPLTDAVRESGEATQLMRVAFDRGLLGTLIAGDGDDAAAGDDVADGETPDPFLAVDEALVWLLIEDGRREIMIDDPAARNVRERAREIAGARGVALRYPAGDDEDRAMLGAADLREGSLARLRVASERYGVPVVLAGRLARDRLGAWEGRWTKFAGDAVEETDVATGSLDEALQEGLAWLSAAVGGDDTYRYGGEATSDAEALVWIGALDSIAAYATVMNFLEGVPGVGTVYPREIDERGMTFTVVPRGALPAIASAAGGLSWLRRTNPPDAPPAGRRAAPDAAAGGERFGGATGRRVDEARPSGAAAGRDDGRRDGFRDGANGSRGGSRDAFRPLAGDAELAFDYLR